MKHPRDSEVGAAFNKRAPRDYAPPFREHEWLLERARQHPPSNPLPTASGFAEWVFELCETRLSRRRNAERSLEIGKEGEFAIEASRRAWIKQLDAPSIEMTDWEVVFRDPLTGSREPFRASRLCVGGEPLRCVPDYVVRNRSSGDVMIVERKVTVVPADQIPRDGWPNMQAQLWCYSWVDAWLHMHDVLLVGHIWRKVYNNFVNSEIYPRFRRSDPTFHERWLALFQLYGGDFVGVAESSA